MKNFIYPEMMVHVPMCTHKDPKNIMLISDDAILLNGELERYINVDVSVVTVDTVLDTLRDISDASVDIILCEADVDTTVVAHCNRVLNADGLIVMIHPSLEDIQANTTLMHILGEYFQIIMPYNIGNGETLLIASKAYHPTADIILQRSDLLEGHQYYNSDIHPAAFAMPNYIRKQYLKIIRN